MQRILFIDDEPKLLNGLENALRKQRKQWAMKFVVSGEEALSELAHTAYDVVICDMRMPGMDGPALLTRVKERYPKTARIVLSGQADQPSILRSLPVAQQFLSKPCDSETLRGTIERLCSLQARVHDDSVQAIVGGLDHLPPSPKIYLDLVAALEQSRTGAAELAAIVEKDPALSAKVLQLANSAFFGRGQRTQSIRAAVMYLGVEVLKVLVLSAYVFLRTDTTAGGRLIRDLQHHATLLARVVPKFVADRKRAEQAVAAALLHDVGLLVFASNAKEHIRTIARTVQASGQSVSEVEEQIGKPSHALAGALLLGTWGLPFDLVEVAAYHHSPSEAPEQTPVDILTAVHAAEALVESIEGRVSEPALDQPFVERVGVGANLEGWRAIAEQVVRADHDENEAS